MIKSPRYTVLSVPKYGKRPNKRPGVYKKTLLGGEGGWAFIKTIYMLDHNVNKSGMNMEKFQPLVSE